MSISRFADVESDVPPAIRRISDGAPVVPIWVNGDGGVTFRFGSKPGRYSKWAPAGSMIDLAADLGSLGCADRWADLAVATWSTEWNYGPGWERLFLDAYGIEPDLERTRYYRALWNLAHPVQRSGTRLP